MFWVIQETMARYEPERDVLFETLERFAIPHQIVQVEGYNLLPEVAVVDGPVVVNGSIRLCQIAMQRGWQPGCFQDSTFSYDVWREPYQEHLLNREAIVGTIAEVTPEWDPVFIKPVRDDKEFDGRVLSLAKFRALQASIARYQRRLLPDLRILCAPVRTVGQEHRHFVVDGRVVSSSRYKLAGQANVSPVVDADVVAFAERMTRLWQPARAFVMDTYRTGDEIGIVEIGGICAAGFYRADVQRIVMALDEMTVSRPPAQ